MNKCLTQSPSKTDMPDVSCFLLLSLAQRLRSSRNKEKEDDRRFDSLNRKLIYQACFFKVLPFAAQGIRSFHCTVNNKKTKPYLTESHWATDISYTPFEVTHSCCPMSE